MKLLLHACCGPCSLEPVRLLQEAGHDLSLAYMNSNIHPAEEYRRRLATLASWAADNSLPVIEGAYSPGLWEQSVGQAMRKPGYRRKDRCRMCYRLRFEEAAAYASEHGFDGVSTTLSVSPYQFGDIIKEELERAAAGQGVAPVFEDFSPSYPEATRRSKDLGMYRQNYCGCRLSDLEAQAEREERRILRKAERAARKGGAAPGGQPAGAPGA